MKILFNVYYAVGIKWHKLEVATRQFTPVFNESRGAFTEKFWASVTAESGPVTWHDVTLESAPQNPDFASAPPPPPQGLPYITACVTAERAQSYGTT